MSIFPKSFSFLVSDLNCYAVLEVFYMQTDRQTDVVKITGVFLKPLVTR
jgi:hypothetical protein